MNVKAKEQLDEFMEDTIDELLKHAEELDGDIEMMLGWYDDGLIFDVAVYLLSKERELRKLRDEIDTVLNYQTKIERGTDIADFKKCLIKMRRVLRKVRKLIR